MRNQGRGGSGQGSAGESMSSWVRRKGKEGGEYLGALGVVSLCLLYPPRCWVVSATHYQTCAANNYSGNGLFGHFGFLTTTVAG